MLKERVAIAATSIQNRYGIPGVITWYLLLQHLQAPQWAYGVAAILLLVLWVAVWITNRRTTFIDLNKKEAAAQIAELARRLQGHQKNV